MVRILRSTLMVRVGGGWIALDEFLVKNDPCRGGYARPTPGALASGWWASLCPGAVPAGPCCPRGTQPTGLPGLREPRPDPHRLCRPPVKGRTNLKINEKYLSPDAFGAAAAKCAGAQSAPSSKVLSPSRSNSSLSLYSSASAPSSPLARKVRGGGGPPRSPEPSSPAAAGADPLPPQSVLRRTRSGDRCPRSRGSLLPDGAELQFTAAEETLAVAPPGEDRAAAGGPRLQAAPHGAGGGMGRHRGAAGAGAVWGRAVGLPPGPRSTGTGRGAGEDAAPAPLCGRIPE